MAGYYSCMACGYEFDPIATRWFCPHCKFKANCCEGEALPPAKPREEPGAATGA